MKVLLLITFIMIVLQSEAVKGLDCVEQSTNVFDTPCGKFYEKIYRNSEVDIKINLFKEWKKYEKQCSETGEYEVYVANTLQAIGKHAEAQSILRKIILEKQKQSDLRLAYQVLLQSLMSDGRSLTDENKLQEIKDIAMQAMVLYPHWYRGYLGYGGALVYQNQFLEGKKYIDQSILLQDSYSEAYGFLTIIYHLHFKDAKMALKTYKKGLLMGQEKMLFSILHATSSVVKCAMNQKDYKTAIWVLERQTELFPQITKVAWYQGLVSQVNQYFRENNISEVFTMEEREGLKSGKILELVSDK